MAKESVQGQAIYSQAIKANTECIEKYVVTHSTSFDK